MKSLRALLFVVAATVGVTACLPPSTISSHHDDPFLACVRQHESGGSYTVDNPNGSYHGAYQFSRSTWDATAQHAGRSDLVGVDPHEASVLDQDEMAWALYQWQGKAPWNGSGC
jgi:hypothetical protein